ncbi:MAG: MlaD family protein [Polyangiaceae bacterium]|nr:MlaD family protein [Polyangiaceae bacterium]
MKSSQKSMEMKVGGLIVGSLILLISLIVVMGGLSLKPTYLLYVTFESPGGLQSGAPVRISGVRVGRVKAIEFQGGEKDKKGHPLPPIRVVASIEERYKKAIHNDARFYVTSQGVLGEMHLAIDPGGFNTPVLASGSTVSGSSPPRLDQLLSESYELLHRSYLGVVANEKELGETFDGLHQTLKTTGAVLEENEERINRIVENVEATSVRVEKMVERADQQYVSGARVNRILNRIDRSTAAIDENLQPILQSSRQILANGETISHFLAREEILEGLQRIVQNTEEATVEAKKAAQNAAAVSEQVKLGRGTIGSLLMEDVVYDDLKEMMRDLKRNPWKIMWKD